MKNILLLACLVVSCLLLSTIGCKGNTALSDVRAANESNVAKLRSCYMLYKSRHNNVAPKSKEELAEFIANEPGIDKNLERMGIERGNFDSFFTSERDGQEVKVKWGVDGMLSPPYVFESEGVDGKYLIAGGEVMEVDKTEYDAWWDGTKKVQGPGDVDENLAEL